MKEMIDMVDFELNLSVFLVEMEKRTNPSWKKQHKQKFWQEGVHGTSNP